MSNVYVPREIERRWQAYWLESKTFAAENPGRPGFDPSRPKYYVLDMFPYPSGAGLHVGHPVGYIGSDVVARRKRMEGHNVLHPMGWDAFGLPAEQYAIQTGKHPKETTAENVANFRRQLRLIGLSYDWDREVEHQRPGVLPLDAVDLHAPLRPRAGLPGRRSRVVVRGAEDRPRQRGGHQRPLRARQLPVREAAAQAVDAADHGVRRPARGRSRGARLARVGQGDATGVDRPVARRRDRVPPRGGAGRVPHRVHHAPRHAVRRDLHGHRAGAPAALEDRDRGPPRRGGGVCRRGRVEVRPRPDRSRQGQDRRLHGRLRAESPAGRAG